MNGPPAQFGLQQHAQQEHNGTVLAHKVKTLTVQQALPYTPFTSIIPFDPCECQKAHATFTRLTKHSDHQSTNLFLDHGKGRQNSRHRNIEACSQRAEQAECQCYASRECLGAVPRNTSRRAEASSKQQLDPIVSASDNLAKLRANQRLQQVPQAIKT